MTIAFGEVREAIFNLTERYEAGVAVADLVADYVSQEALRAADSAPNPGGQKGYIARPGVLDGTHCVHPLLPAEHIAYTVSKSQIGRGENPPRNTTAALLLAIERLSGIDRPEVAP